jgi:CIC family chloride channel protein
MSRDRHDGVSSPLRWFPEYLELGSARLRKQSRLLGLALVVGVVAGLGAIVFFCACELVSHFALGELAGYAPRGPGGEPHLFTESAGYLRPWMLLLLPTVGGLISGFLVYTFAPEAEGHGTDSAIDAYHRKQGYIRPLVPIIKIISSAITLGTGGSGGREGPIAQTGAGFGSVVAGMLKLRPGERRVLMAAGMAAGIAAIFKAPLAGALFAAEVLYRSPDFESDVIIPAGLASCTAYATFGAFFGYQSLFNLPERITLQLGFNNPAHLLSYLILAICMAILAMIYTRSFYGLTYLFHRLKLVPHLKPAIGAFLNGAVGLLLFFGFRQDQRVLAVLSFGYSTLQEAVQYADTNTSLYFGLLLLAVSLGKILTTSLTIGSGGSGGVFGPAMVIGGCGAGALGIFMHELWAPLCPSPSTFVIVGMAGFFAAAAKTPISTLVIVSEMTGNYQLLLPTLWVCAIAFLVSDEQSLYRSQVESRSLSPAHQGDYIREVLAGMQVRQFLTPTQEVPLLHADDSLPAVLARLSGTNYHAIPVVDGDNALLGIVSLEEVYIASQSPNLAGLVLAADLMRTDVTPLQPDDRIDRALELFVESDLLALPVVEGVEAPRVIGIVKRADVSSTYLRFVQGDGSDAGAGI